MADIRDSCVSCDVSSVAAVRSGPAGPVHVGLSNKSGPVLDRSGPDRVDHHRPLAKVSKFVQVITTWINLAHTHCGGALLVYFPTVNIK
jgi:hypothetical protein